MSLVLITLGLFLAFVFGLSLKRDVEKDSYRRKAYDVAHGLWDWEAERSLMYAEPVLFDINYRKHK